MKVYAVMGGYDFNENYVTDCMKSLRLFDCFSSADAYCKQLTQVDGYDYAVCDVKEVCMESALLRAA
jgi:hypothetical protein